MSFAVEWDLADPRPDGVTVETLRDMIAAARPYVGQQPPPAPVPLRLVPDTPVDLLSGPAPLAALTTLPNRTEVEVVIASANAIPAFKALTWP